MEPDNFSIFHIFIKNYYFIKKQHHIEATIDDHFTSFLKFWIKVFEVLSWLFFCFFALKIYQTLWIKKLWNKAGEGFIKLFEAVINSGHQ